MSHFSKTEDFKLVNRFTIEHEGKLSDGRPYMSTRVPQQIFIDLFDIGITRTVDWKDKVESATDPDYRYRTAITARGSLNDRITVFTIPGGEVAQFREIAEITILPRPKWHHKEDRTSPISQGILFSGMSSRKVPDEGLMSDQPGTLIYLDPRDNPWLRRNGREPYLHLDVFVDESVFAGFVRDVSECSLRARSGVLGISVELFQYEVESALAESWMPQDYGFLIDSDADSGAVKARVEMLRIDHGGSAKSSIGLGEVPQNPASGTFEVHAKEINDNGSLQAITRSLQSMENVIQSLSWQIPLGLLVISIIAWVR